MKRLELLGLVVTAIALTSCGSGMTLARSTRGNDLDGTWQIDPARSDALDRGGYRAPDGDWNRDDTGSYPDNIGSYRPGDRIGGRLPEVLRISSDRGTVHIEDQDGNLVQQIVIDDSDYGYNDDGGDRTDERDRGVYNGDGAYDRDRRTARGRWVGDRTLQVTSDDGRRIKRTLSLQDRGRQLVVRTEIEGRRGTRSFTYVYDRS